MWLSHQPRTKIEQEMRCQYNTAKIGETFQTDRDSQNLHSQRRPIISCCTFQNGIACLLIEVTKCATFSNLPALVSPELQLLHSLWPMD
jgi:hypothetical protein